MNVLGIQDSDVFQIQLVEFGKERTKKNSSKNTRRKNSVLTYKYHN
jgi:hypothetical protein